MGKSIVKKDTFSTKAYDGIVVEDAYSSKALEEVNRDTPSVKVKSGLLDEGIPPKKVHETEHDPVLQQTAKKEGKSLVEATRDIVNDLPREAKLGDILKNNKISEVGIAIRRITGSLPGGDIGSLSDLDLNYLIRQTNGLTEKILNKDGNLTLDDLKDANGFDMVVGGAVALLVIRQAMGKGSVRENELFESIAGTNFPTFLKNAGIDAIIDIAGEFGLADVAAALFEIADERAKPKIKGTIQSLLSNFRFTDKPIITEVSKGERSLIASAAEFFGANETESNLISEIVEIARYDEEYVSKPDQAKKFIDNLYRIDKNWNLAKRNGAVVKNLDNYKYANRWAIEALLTDERTRADILIHRDRRLKNRTWGEIATDWYPAIYV